MNPEDAKSFSDIVVTYNDEVIGNVESISAEIILDSSDDSLIGMFDYPKSIEGTFTLEYIDESFMDDLGLYPYQRELLRREMRKQQLEKTKKKKISMRESMNNHFKRSKKW